ncbi:MAG: hypothetical protein CME36_04825 [unclassified Hahellaceae]|nr:hypothetical protein [Hahellaceae bacterium]|tara:strand:+ start:3002 stop:3631 length:630 start_codon:yes stop_codon:yes gene_type:complete
MAANYLAGTFVTGRVVLTLLVAVWLSGCQERSPSGDESGKAVLENGYAQLYELTSTLKSSDTILNFKQSTDGFGELVSELATDEASMAEYLEALAKEPPGYDLANTGYPEISKRSLNSAKSDRLLSYSPFFGRTKDNFERTYLLSLSNALTQQYHLLEVMIDLERDKERLVMLKEFQSDVSRYYDEVVAKLNRQHFKENVPGPSLEEGA